MNFLELLKEALKKGGVSDEVISSIISTATPFVTESDTNKNQIVKLTNEIKDRDTKITSLTDNITEIKTMIGVGADVPINADLIKSKMGGGVELETIELKYNDIINGLNTKFAEDKAGIESQLTEKENEIYSLKLDNKISSMLPTINPNEGALDDIIRYVKDGAIIKANGEIGYANDGVAIRNDKGFELTILDRVEELKKDRAYLFNVNVGSGGNVGSGYTPPASNAGNLSAFGQRMALRAKQNRGY